MKIGNQKYTMQSSSHSIYNVTCAVDATLNISPFYGTVSGITGVTFQPNGQPLMFYITVCVCCMISY